MSNLIHELIKDFDTSCYIMMISNGFVVRFNLFENASELLKLLMQIFEINLIIPKKINGKSKDVLISEIPEYFSNELRIMRQRISSPLCIIIKNNSIVINKDSGIVYTSPRPLSIKNNINLFYNYLYTEESINNKIMKIIKES